MQSAKGRSLKPEEPKMESQDRMWGSWGEQRAPPTSCAVYPWAGPGGAMTA